LRSRQTERDVSFIGGVLSFRMCTSSSGWNVTVIDAYTEKT